MSACVSSKIYIFFFYDIRPEYIWVYVYFTFQMNQDPLKFTIGSGNLWEFSSTELEEIIVIWVVEANIDNLLYSNIGDKL